VRCDGAVRAVRSRGQIITGQGGRPARLAGTTHDITERKRTEERLRKMSLVVEQSPVSVVITDVRGNIEYVNPKFVQLTG